WYSLGADRKRCRPQSEVNITVTDLVSTQMQSIGSVADRAKDEALLPERVPNVRPGVEGPKTDSSNAFAPCARILDLCRGHVTHVARALEGAAPRLIPPMYAPQHAGAGGQTWGTRPGSKAWFFAPTIASPTTTRRSAPSLGQHFGRFPWPFGGGASSTVLPQDVNVIPSS
ncbi:MAG: hypothetical protein QOJ42_707, partial [Acidobacteriaceae bacterium]|nr:hypothetical protein [Acidobacteriaceae bacterium]